MAEQTIGDYTRIYLGRGLYGQPLAAPDTDQLELGVSLLDMGEELETAVRFPEHLLAGLAVDRPDAAAVPPGTLYSATDDAIVYQSDGTSWTAWATGGGGGGASASDTACWLPLTTTVAGDDVLVFDADHSLIPTLIPL
jgi:hypothetical protein